MMPPNCSWIRMPNKSAPRFALAALLVVASQARSEEHMRPPPLAGVRLPFAPTYERSLELLHQQAPEGWATLRCRDATTQAYGDRWKAVSIALMSAETRSLYMACLAAVTAAHPERQALFKSWAWDGYNEARALNGKVMQPDFTKTYGITVVP